jgi:hypothetical protein
VCAHLAPFVRSAYLSPGENMIVLKFYRRIKRENCFLMPRCVFSVRLRRDRERQYTKCNRDGIKIEKSLSGKSIWRAVGARLLIFCIYPVHVYIELHFSHAQAHETLILHHDGGYCLPNFTPS